MKRFRCFRLVTMVCFLVSIGIPFGMVEAQKQCDIAAVEERNIGWPNLMDNAATDRAARELGSYSNIGVVRVKDLQDLQTKVSEKFAEDKCDCINNLYIVGHGKRGSITVGDGEYKNTSNGHIDGNEAQWRSPLLSISFLFCSQTPQLFLIACNMGACDEGSSKLYKLAQELGAIVKAPVDKPEFEWDENYKLSKGLVDYMQHGRWQMATPTQKPSHMAAKTDDKAPTKKITAEKVSSCPCDGSTYSSPQECNAACPTGLACFNLTCTDAYINNTWEKYAGNPVLTGGTSAGVSSPTTEGAIANWDQGGVARPSVIKDGSTYAMWFYGWDASGIERIGYATSTDGVHWTKYSGNPVLDVGSSGSWDAGGVYNPSVIKDGGVYKMWYHGYSDMSRIGYATSTDGINWTKHPNNPVLDLGPDGTWDYHGVGAPTVIKDGNLYKMWYIGYDGWWWRIGYATSPDGINWTKHPNNPVIREGAEGSWEEGHVWMPSVIKDGNTYHMLYTGTDPDDIYHIGYATSADGIQWTKSPNNPQLNPGLGIQEWDNGGVGDSTFFKDRNEGVFKVFYWGMSQDTGSGSSYGIGYAIATALVTQATTGGCDFNGDGKTDILWRNKSTGQNVVWLMNGTALSSYSWIDTVADTNWQIVGTGDFNGDGKTDILWRNKSTGQNIVWLMNGTTYSSYAELLQVTDTNWQIGGTADFNSDGKTDILWRNKSTGQNVVWFMNGATQSSYSYIDTVADTNWQIVGTGDFNGDGKTDILWRNKSTGQDVVWYMNGAAFSSYSWIDTVADTNWQIVGTGDFNGDGKTDILWRNKSTGQNVVWYMNGATYSSYAEILQVADTNWQIVGTGDFNGDGKTDILWRNKSTGQNIVWLMNGTSLSTYAELMQVADTNWEIVGPK